MTSWSNGPYGFPYIDYFANCLILAEGYSIQKSNNKLAQYRLISKFWRHFWILIFGHHIVRLSTRRRHFSRVETLPMAHRNDHRNRNSEGPWLDGYGEIWIVYSFITNVPRFSGPFLTTWSTKDTVQLLVEHFEDLEVQFTVSYGIRVYTT